MKKLERKDEADKECWSQEGNPWREKGRFASRDDADVYTTGDTPPTAGCDGGKGSASGGKVGTDHRACGRGPGLKGRSGFLCRSGEPDLNEEHVTLRTIIDEEIRGALSRIYSRMRQRAEVQL